MHDGGKPLSYRSGKNREKAHNRNGILQCRSYFVYCLLLSKFAARENYLL